MQLKNHDPMPAMDRHGMNAGDTITLRMESSDFSRTFTILERMGEGANTFAYRASYQSDDYVYHCILKELYPKDCGIYRDMEHHAFFKNMGNEEENKMRHSRYLYKRQQCKDTYQLQLSFYNAEDYKKNMPDDCREREKILNFTTSVPMGIYMDGEIMYTMFAYPAGECYWNYHPDHEKLSDIVGMILQIAQVAQAYHEKGYYWLDIKEKNVFITWDKVQMFDFGSLISAEVLKNCRTYGDIPLSYSTSAEELLLPPELEEIRTCSSRENLLDAIESLGIYGDLADMYLIASMLFKRIFGRTARYEELPETPDNWELPESKFELEVGCAQKLKSVLVKAMHYSYLQRYETMGEFITELQNLWKLALLSEEQHYYQSEGYSVRYHGTSKEYLACRSMEQMIMLGDAHEKFERLRKLSERFESKVMLRNEEDEACMPERAIAENRLTFLYGDGGMGKSTTLYDCMRSSGKICFYIELNRYRNLRKEDGGRNNFILCEIVKNICHKAHNIPFDCMKTELEGIYDQMEHIEMTHFQKETNRTEYLLLLDGYNEMNHMEQDAFEGELDYLKSNWENVDIVVTGRELPKTATGESVKKFDEFRKYKFIGISESERTRILTEKLGAQAAATIRNNENLWEVLRIPMFLGMYLTLGTDVDSSVQTRGEILDCFVTSSERDAADRVSRNRPGQNRPADYRKFVIELALPFAANRMDRENGFYTENLDWNTELEKGWNVYFSNKKVKFTYTDGLDYIKELTEFNSKTIKNLLLNETAYCAYSNGKYSFTHQYFRDYFAAKHIQNILNTAEKVGGTKEEQLEFILSHGLDYTWSDDVCLLLGEIIGDYKNVPN